MVEIEDGIEEDERCPWAYGDETEEELLGMMDVSICIVEIKELGIGVNVRRLAPPSSPSG